MEGRKGWLCVDEVDNVHKKPLVVFLWHKDGSVFPKRALVQLMNHAWYWPASVYDSDRRVSYHIRIWTEAKFLELYNLVTETDKPCALPRPGKRFRATMEI